MATGDTLAGIATSPRRQDIVVERVSFKGVPKLQLTTISLMIWGEVFESSPHDHLRLP